MRAARLRWRAGLPWATVTLLVTMFAAYFLISEGALYADKEALARISFTPTSPLTLLTHLFAHVGFLHLVSNALPALGFALVCELALLPQQVLALWLTSGIGAALLFAVMTPGKALIGGSAAIAGLIAAALLLKPKAAALALIATPLALAVVMQAAAQLTTVQVAMLVQEKQVLAQRVEAVMAQNRSEEAAQANVTLVAVARQAEKLTKGIAHEAATPTEIPVHVYGFVLGIVYVALFARRETLHGVDELIASLRWLRDRLAHRLRSRRGMRAARQAKSPAA